MWARQNAAEGGHRIAVVRLGGQVRVEAGQLVGAAVEEDGVHTRQQEHRLTLRRRRQEQQRRQLGVGGDALAEARVQRCTRAGALGEVGEHLGAPGGIRRPVLAVLTSHTAAR